MKSLRCTTLLAAVAAAAMSAAAPAATVQWGTVKTLTGASDIVNYHDVGGSQVYGLNFTGASGFYWIDPGVETLHSWFFVNQSAFGPPNIDATWSYTSGAAQPADLDNGLIGIDGGVDFLPTLPSGWTNDFQTLMRGAVWSDEWNEATGGCPSPSRSRV